MKRNPRRTSRTHEKYNKKIKTNTKASKKMLIPFIIIFLFVISLIGLSYYNTNKYYIKVGDTKITKSEYQYFYQYTLNKFQNDFSEYEDYLNIDFSKDLSEQTMKDGITWEEYFISQTDMLIYETLSTYNEAKANNFTASTKEVETTLDSMALYANNNGMLLNEYLKYLYGNNASLKLIKHSLEINCISEKYLNNLCSENITEDEYEEYYNKNKDSLDEVEFYCIPFSSKQLAETAMNSIKTKEQFIDKSIEIQNSDGYNKITGLSNCNTLYAEWIFNAENNSMKIIEDSANSTYYLLYKIDRHKNESPSKNTYIISVQKEDDSQEYFDKITEIEDEFDGTEKKEKDFIKLAKKYNKDGSNGYSNNMTEQNVTLNLRVWLFGERNIGDTTIIMDDNNYMLIYYAGDGIPQYKANSASQIVTEKSEKIIESIKEKYEFKKR